MDGHWHCSRTRLVATTLQPPRKQLGRRHSPLLPRCPSRAASDVRFVCQLYADDVAILAGSAEDLQRGLDAVTSWGRKWRFTFGVSPEKSAVMIFGPSRRTPSCSVTLSNLELPVVRAYRYLGVILTPSLSWSAHISHLTTRGLRLLAQSTTWSRSEGLSLAGVS